ncbi:PRTRC system protein B [Flavobacterium oncorhynchi]|jgi:PRTRC genetic system protein B|uniref:PRTRC system protein B n=1 Tax=Flavobacterium oncorhynchi TaxID=728056 RepID=A0A226I0K2_9FLAO|nr:PRTRC system protein B [Flavobacterium oncorhynchi]OXA99150.1 PRTRC system protein B [Flavobacterium oncorhynchi]
MKNTNDITASFGTLYYPKSALVFYQARTDNDVYVEHFDMDKNGNPVNAHPLTEREANALAKSLQTERVVDKAFLSPKGIVPTNILHFNPSENGKVLWYSKAQEKELFFVKTLGIPSAKAKIPTLLWHADKQHLYLFALANNGRPKEQSFLYHAPFFNVYENGNVCMGTVDVNIKKSTSLEEFISAWENYFFNSYFSHLMQGHNPVKENCVTLWKKLVTTHEAFPSEVLIKNNKKLKNLLP